MKKSLVALVGVASHDESGGYRAEELLDAAEKRIKAEGFDVYRASRVVWTQSDALVISSELEDMKISSLVVLNITWVADSLLYLLLHKIHVPFALWAVPFTETFALGCVQHMGATLKMVKFPFQPLYGDADNPNLIKKLVRFLKASAAICEIRNMRVALMGPRQTWRVAGPQDMSLEEWDFSLKFGVTIIHFEMDELLDRVDKIDDSDAKITLACLEKRIGNSSAGEERMIFAAKVYKALKQIIEENSLAGIAAECYPKFDGITNLSAAWLADEGIVIETEGDISNTVLRAVLNSIDKEGTTFLGEAGSYNVNENYMFMSHGGSTAPTLSDELKRVEVSASGEMGTYVGTPIKAMKDVTISNLTGSNGNYKMLIASGETLQVSDEDYDKTGKRLASKVRFKNADIATAFEKLFKSGIDHHLVLREGDHTDILATIADLMGIEKVII
ncbi:MAG: hypothetical protein GX222_06515 [Ruminococcaceae bacterium]|nr:hypothetical protein [Oscillospiraceae bacterium]